MDDLKAVAAAFAQLYRYLVLEACVPPRGAYYLLQEVAAGTEPGSMHTHGAAAQAALVAAARAAYAANPLAEVTTWDVAEDCLRDAAAAGRLCRRTGLAYAISEDGRRVLIHAVEGTNPAALRKVGDELAKRHAIERGTRAGRSDVEIQVVPEGIYTRAGLPLPDLSRPSYREPAAEPPREAPARSITMS